MNKTEAIEGVKEVIEAPWKTFFRERWDHPLGGPYLFAWAAWNREFLIVCFSDGKYDERIKYLNNIWPHTIEEGAHFFGFPLLFALAYFLLAPQSKPLQEIAEGTAEFFLRNVRGFFSRRYKYTAKEIDAITKSYQEQVTKISEDKDNIGAELRGRNDYIKLKKDRFKALWLERADIRENAAIIAKSQKTADRESKIGLHTILQFSQDDAVIAKTVAAWVAANGLDISELMLLAALKSKMREDNFASMAQLTVDDPKFFMPCYHFTQLGLMQTHWEEGFEPYFSLTDIGVTLVKAYAKEHTEFEFLMPWRAALLTSPTLNMESGRPGFSAEFMQ